MESLEREEEMERKENSGKYWRNEREKEKKK